MFKKLSQKAKKVLCMVLAAVLCIMLLSGCSGKKINLDNYVTVSFDGYNGSGTATATLDTSKISEDYDGKVKFNTKSNLALMYELDEEDVGNVISDFAYVTVDPSSGLSNGDTVTLQWDVDGTYIKNILKCSVSYSDKTCKVGGLK